MKAASTKIEAAATCRDCAWSSSAANSTAIGSQHAERHYHRVKVVEHRSIVFDGETAEMKARRAPSLF